jgi:hypothetical protein
MSNANPPVVTDGEIVLYERIRTLIILFSSVTR